MKQVCRRDLRHHTGGQHHEYKLTRQRWVDIFQRGHQHHVAENLRTGQAHRHPSFNLGFGHAFDTGANDFCGVSAQVDGQGKHTGCHHIKLDANARQAEKDQEQLNNQRGVADHFHVDPSQAA